MDKKQENLENTAAAEKPAEDKSTAEVKSSKYQTLILVGIGLIVLGIIFVAIALYQPKISAESVVTVTMNTVTVDNGETVTEPLSGEGEDSSAVSSADSTAGAAAQTSSAANSGGAAATTQAATAAQTTASSVSYPLNLNTCTQAELETLDSIGESRAYAIISYREYLGGYTSTEQIKDIKGIGDGIYEKIKAYITV